jgi:hypothetical protein
MLSSYHLFISPYNVWKNWRVFMKLGWHNANADHSKFVHTNFKSLVATKASHVLGLRDGFGFLQACRIYPILCGNGLCCSQLVTSAVTSLSGTYYNLFSTYFRNSYASGKFRLVYTRNTFMQDMTYPGRWISAMNILNKQLPSADTGWSFSVCLW